jgi:hypothetical protein
MEVMVTDKSESSFADLRSASFPSFPHIPPKKKDVMSGATAGWVGGYLARGVYSEAKIAVTLSGVRGPTDSSTAMYRNQRTTQQNRPLPLHFGSEESWHAGSNKRIESKGVRRLQLASHGDDAAKDALQ